MRPRDPTPVTPFSTRPALWAQLAPHPIAHPGPPGRGRSKGQGQTFAFLSVVWTKIFVFFTVHKMQASQRACGAARAWLVLLVAYVCATPHRDADQEGLALFERGDFEGAIPLLQACVNANPCDVWSWQLLALALQETRSTAGWRDAALSAWEAVRQCVVSGGDDSSTITVSVS